MHRTTELGLVYGPYGGIGLVERHAPTRSAERVSLWRLFRRWLTLV